jgi:hypothetical protein
MSVGSFEMQVIDKVVASTALAAAVLGLGFLGTLPAKASTWDVTFDGANLDVSAVVTTGKTLDALGGYNITAITGTVTALTTGVTGGSITGLIANPNQPYQGTYYNSSGLGWNYDNVLFANGQPIFDNNGPLFSFVTSTGTDILANLYSVGTQFYLSVDNPTSLWSPGDPGTLQASDPPATPLPATLSLFATGLAIVGLFGWRRKRKSAVAFAT